MVSCLLCCVFCTKNSSFLCIKDHQRGPKNKPKKQLHGCECKVCKIYQRGEETKTVMSCFNDIVIHMIMSDLKSLQTSRLQVTISRSKISAYFYLTLSLLQSSIDDLVFSVFPLNFFPPSYKISLLKNGFVTFISHLIFIKFSKDYT